VGGQILQILLLVLKRALVKLTLTLF